MEAIRERKHSQFKPPLFDERVFVKNDALEGGQLVGFSDINLGYGYPSGRGIRNRFIWYWVDEDNYFSETQETADLFGITQPELVSLVRLLSHPDADVRAQGVDTLETLSEDQGVDWRATNIMSAGNTALISREDDYNEIVWEMARISGVAPAVYHVELDGGEDLLVGYDEYYDEAIVENWVYGDPWSNQSPHLQEESLIYDSEILSELFDHNSSEANAMFREIYDDDGNASEWADLIGGAFELEFEGRDRSEG